MTGSLAAESQWPGSWLTGLAAGIDGLALEIARFLLDRGVIPPPEAAGRLRDTAAFYRRPELLEDPRRFFAYLDRGIEPPAVALVERPWRDGARRAWLSFLSPYTPSHPEHHAEYAAQQENHRAVVELWRHREDEARGTLIGLHGFGMGRPALDSTALMAPAFFRMGLDIALFTLPLHGARTPRGARFSGELFARPDIRRINEAMGQAVHDLVLLIAWLRRRNPRPIGFVGLSLGGYVAALMAALAEHLDFVVPMVAPVCFGDLAYRFMAESRHYRSAPEAALSREELRSAFWVHSPLAHAPRVPRERLLIVAGRGDRVVPAEHAEWLAEHWGHPQMHWFDGGHVAPFGRGRIQRTVARFLRELEIV